MILLHAGPNKNTFSVDRVMKVNGRISDDVVNIGNIVDNNGFITFAVNGSDLLSLGEMQTIMQKMNEMMYANYAKLAGFDGNRPVS